MMPLDILLDYFPTGTAEGERHILKKAFVQIDEFAEIITPPPSSPRVLVGKKGSGKSAIIDFSMEMFKNGGIPAVKLKPVNIDISRIPENSSVGEVTRAAYRELATAVANVVGSSVSGLISGDDRVLYEQAVKDGLLERDVVGKLARLLPTLSKSFTGFDFSSLIWVEGNGNSNRLIDALKSNFKKTGSAFYIFIDDTDQVAAPDRPGHLNRIWGFLLAAREFTQDIENVRCIISLREEVWRRITSDKAGQRDQTDHFSGLVKFLNPTQEHVRKIIERRIDLAEREIDSESLLWRRFFEPNDPLIPTTDQRSSWADLIITRSRERPRDAVQLINSLAKSAKESGLEKITDSIFAKEMVEFSRQRVSLLAQEAEYDCPELERVVRTFAELKYDHGSFKATAHAVKEHLGRFCLNTGVHLFGRALRADQEDDALALWKYLFDIGFLNARVADDREKDGYKHIFPRSDPNFVSKARWNDMQAIVWEIGPSYRDFLIGVQKDRSARFGLPPKSPKSRKRRR